jgi:hypothetical protein
LRGARYGKARGILGGQPHHRVADDIGFPLAGDELRIEALDLAAIAAIEAWAIGRRPRTGRKQAGTGDRKKKTEGGRQTSVRWRSSDKYRVR